MKKRREAMLTEKLNFRFKERLKITLLIFPVLLGISAGLINSMWLLFSSPHLFWNLIDRIAFIFFSIFFYAGMAAIIGLVLSIIPVKPFFNNKEFNKIRLISFYISIFISGSVATFFIMQTISFSIFHLQIVRNLIIMGIALISVITVTMLLYNILKKSNIITKFGYFIFIMFKKKSFMIVMICLLLFVVINFLVNEVWYFKKIDRFKKPNIILISLDTLGARHLSCYGYFRNTTPNIDRFAQRSILFENAFSQSRWTLPSHMSMMTSVYPSVHTVVNAEESVLDDSFLTLAEVLKEYGYYSGAFVQTGRNNNVGAAHGFDQGFDFYEHYPERFNKYEKLYIISHPLNFIKEFLHSHSIPHMHAEKISNEALSWLKHYDSSQPFFLFLHYYDIHGDHSNKLPYVSPPQFMRMHYPDYGGSFTGCGESGKCGWPYLSEIVNKLGNNEKIISKDDLDYIISLYDGGISYVDKHVGLLLEGLDKLKLTDNTIIIITADHGEEFLEHHKFGHGQYYNEIIHVPLIIKFPKDVSNNKQVKPSVRLIDIVPTILTYIDIPISEQFQGENLLPYIFDTNNSKLENLIVFGGLDKPVEKRTPIRYVRMDSFKLITKTKRDSDIVKELYNLQLDPAELINVIETETKVREKFDKYLLSWDEECIKLRKSKVSANRVKKLKIDEKTKAELKALGYIK